MKNKKKSINWHKITFFIIVILCIVSGYYYFTVMEPESARQYNEWHGYEGTHINSCGSEFSCECRDRCFERFGHSSWESWVLNKQGECWCVEQNKSERIF